MRASKVSAALLLGMLRFALLVGIAHFRPKNVERGNMEMEDCFRHSIWRKWLFVILRILPLIGYFSAYFHWILEEKDFVHVLFNSVYLGFSITCYLWIIGLQIFHGKSVIELVNKILRLISRVRAFPFQKNIGFGGKRELVLIILTLLSQVGEFVNLFFSEFYKENIIEWSCLYYVTMITHIIPRINIVWYLHVGVLYAKVNEYARLQMRLLKNSQGYAIFIRQSDQILSFYREINMLTSSFQALFNVSLFFSLTLSQFYVVAFSYKMLLDLELCDFWKWSLFLTIIYDFLLLSLAVEGAANQFKDIRQIQSELSCFGEHKELQRFADVFATQLNLYPFRVRLLGLCDISMELFLKTSNGVITYLIFVIQCVLQMKN